MRVREAVARLDDLDGRVDAATAATAADADAAAGCPWLGLLRDRLRLQNQGPTRSTERRERLLQLLPCHGARAPRRRPVAGAVVRGAQPGQG